MSSLLRWWTCAALLLAGCFEDTYEPPPANATTGGSCTEGELGCACFPNATCGEGLSCATSVNTCVPEGCTPGELACSCADDGSCAAPAVCTAGICRDPDDPPDTDTTPSDGTTDATSGGPGTTTVDPTVTTTGSDTSTSTDTTAGETLATDCDQGDCEQCLECADVEVTACATEHATCQTVPGCITVANCLRNCGLTGLCFEACCDGMTQLAIDNAFALTVCGTDTCVDTCAAFEFPSTCPT